MKNAAFNKLLQSLTALQGKKRWTYDNAAGYDLSVYTADKVYGFLFDSLYKSLHVTVYNMQGDCIGTDVFILSAGQADTLYNLFLGV